VQPVELPEGWSESFRGGGGFGAASTTGAGFVGGAPPPPAPMMAAPAPMIMRSAPMPMAPSPSMAPGGPPPAPSAAPKGGLLDKARALAKKALAPRREAERFDEAEESDDLALSPVADFGSDGFASSGAFEPPAEAAPMELERAVGESRTRAGVAPNPGAIAAELAKTQKADGSFGGDPLRTAAALLALVLIGHTRRSGARSRVVLKAATFLDAHRGVEAVAAAFRALEAAERGDRPAAESAWEALRGAGPEGAFLRIVEHAPGA
jgi:hypothetical protein